MLSEGLVLPSILCGTVRFVGIRRASLAVATLVVVGLLAMPISALASHEPSVEEVVAVARSETWNMSCEPTPTSVECTASDFDFTWFERASIRPAMGTLIALDTAVTVFNPPLDPYFRGWHFALQQVGCAPTEGTGAELNAFIATVADRADAGNDGPITIGDECTISGGLRIVPTGSVSEYTYFLRSTVLAPTVPTPTPQPSARPTASPTPIPTIPPSVAATPTPAPSASPTATPSPSSPTAIPSATATPEQSVLAGTPAPTSSAEPVVAPSSPAPGSDDLRRGALAAAVALPSEISVEPMAIGGSALLALVLLLFIAFTSELFNSTFESNYDEIAGWLRLRRGPPGRMARFWTSPIGVGAFLAAGALVYLLLDPSVALDVQTVAIYLGMLAGLGAVMLAFEAPPLLLYRRRTGASPGVRALPWTLPAAALCVLVSRVASLEPGYLYGLLLGLVFTGELTKGQEGRQTAAGAAWTLAAALVAWIALGALRSSGIAPDAFGPLLLETALAVVVVGGLEAVAFGLLPMRFLSGAAVYGWSRIGWAMLFGIGAFAFIHVLVGPHTGYLSELSATALIAALGAFAAFGTFSVLFWGYFRFRPARVSV